MKFSQPWLLCLFAIMFITYQNSYAQKETRMISAGAVISRITEKPFDYSQGQLPGIRPMFEYQVEKNIYGGYCYTYGIGFKALGERGYKVIENHTYHDIKITNLGESLRDGWRVDTLFTYVGDLTSKYRIKLWYIYLPAGITYYAREKLSFGAEYSLAYVWSGKYNFDVMFSDITNNYKYDYSANLDLPANKGTNDKYMYRWDHWIRFSARYEYKDYLFRLGFEKGLRNFYTGDYIPATSNGKPIDLKTIGIFWQNTSIFLSVGVKLPN